jgi:hypothetical protein
MSAATADLLADTGGFGQAGHRCACAAGRGGDESPVHLAAPNARVVRSWPLLVLAAPAAVAVWSGWVGIGQMTGFGQVHPLPGIWDSLHLNTAITLPIGVEAYAAYALRAWLATGLLVSARTRRFAKWSAIGSLLLAMAGQVAYHLLTEAGTRHAPWGITMAVSCLPVLVLGMGSALTHMVRADAAAPGGNDLAMHQLVDRPADWTASCGDREGTDRSASGDGAEPPGPTDQSARTEVTDSGDSAGAGGSRVGNLSPGLRSGDRRCGWGQPQAAARLAAARAAARQLDDERMRVSRRTLRYVGLRGSNADLGALARIVRSELAAEGSSAWRPAAGRQRR